MESIEGAQLAGKSDLMVESECRGREAWAWSPCGGFLAHVRVLPSTMKRIDLLLLLHWQCSARASLLHKLKLSAVLQAVIASDRAVQLRVIGSKDGRELLQSSSPAPAALPAKAQLQGVQMAWTGLGDRLLCKAAYSSECHCAQAVHCAAFDFV